MRFYVKKILAVLCLVIIIVVSYAGCAVNMTSFLQKRQAASSSYTASSQNANISVYFPRAGQNAEGQVVSAYENATKRIDVAIYSFTDVKIAKAMIDAKKRGDAVRVITDKEESGSSYQKTVLSEIKAAGIPVKRNEHSGLMHLKVSIVDSSTVLTGSFNYTTSAQKLNDENLLVITNSSSLNNQYETEFQMMWNDSSNYISI